MDPMRGMVKMSSPRILDDDIWVAYDLDPTMKLLRGGPVSKVLSIQKIFAKGPSKAKVIPLSSPN